MLPAASAGHWLKFVTRVVMGLAQAVSKAASSSASARRGEKNTLPALRWGPGPVGEGWVKVFMSDGYTTVQFCSAAWGPLK